MSNTVLKPPVFPEEGPIGEELARELVAWIRATSEPVREEIRAWLAERTDQETHFTSMSVAKFAQHELRPESDWFTFGAGYAGQGGNTYLVTIRIHRDGSITWKPLMMTIR